MKRGVFYIACIAVVVAVVAGMGSAGLGDRFQFGAFTGGNPTVSASTSADTNADTGTNSDPSYEQGVVLIGLRDGATAADLNALLPKLDYIATKQIADDDITLGYAGLALANGVSVEDAEAHIAADASDVVSAAQPNYLLRLFDDPDASNSKSSFIAGIIAQAQELAVNDEYYSAQWALSRINVKEAWGTQTTDKAVTVAVLDNGFLTTHEDLANNIVTSYNAVTNGRTGVESATHGTHVSGIVAAEANNKVGIAGVSYNAGILPIQVFDGEYTNVTTLLAAYAYLINNAQTYNIRVANMSLGAYQATATLADIESNGSNDALVKAVKRAQAAGILTVCAAGNQDDKTPEPPFINYPCDWLGDCALNVIATDNSSDNGRASFSNYNVSGQTAKNISAPGSEIYSTVSSSETAYAIDSGTSMAAPCVAGIAALVFAADPELTADEARDILCKTADSSIGDAGWDKETGYGLVDAKAAVSKAKEGASNGSGDGDGGNGDGSGDNEGNETGDGGSEGDDNSGSDGDGGAGEGDGEPEDKGGSEGDGDPESKDDAEEEVVNDSATLTDKPADQKRSDINPITETVVTAPAGTKITKLKAGKRSFTVKWKKQATQTSGYQVQYSLKKSFKSKRKTVTVSKVKTTSKKIKKLKAKKRYYVRVRTFKVVGGERYYSAWSARKSVKTRA